MFFAARLPQTRAGYAIILGLLAALGPLCTDLYLPALPDVSQTLHITASTAQLSLTASLLGLGVGQIIFGPLSDRWGRLHTLLISLLIMIIASIACAMSQNITQLVCARLIQGIAGSGGIVLSRAIARDQYQGIGLTQFFALLMMVNGIAPILAPVLGGGLLMVVDWRGIFAVLALIGILLLLFSHLQLKETLPKEDRHPGGLTSSIKAMGGLLKHRQFMGLCLTQGFIFAGMFAYIAASSFVLQDIYHLSAQQFSFCFAVNGLGLVIAAQIASRLSLRHGERAILKAVLILATLAAALLFLISFTHPSLWVVLPILFITIMVNSMIGTTGTALAMRTIPSHSGGGASALIGLAMFGLGAASSPISGLGGGSLLSMTGTIFGCYFIAFILFVVLAGWKTKTR